MQPLAMESYAVTCASGTLRSRLPGDGVTHFAHRWTSGGVDVAAPFTGAHLLHASIAACVLNDLYREAEKLGVPLDGVLVEAEGGFTADWASTGISYRVRLDSPADPDELRRLLAIVDEVAEIPRAVRAGADVARVG